MDFKRRRIRTTHSSSPSFPPRLDIFCRKSGDLLCLRLGWAIGLPSAIKIRSVNLSGSSCCNCLVRRWPLRARRQEAEVLMERCLSLLRIPYQKSRFLRTANQMHAEWIWLAVLKNSLRTANQIHRGVLMQPMRSLGLQNSKTTRGND